MAALSPINWSAMNQQSQAGKSFFLLDLARFFCPLFSLSKITELVYVCNSISPKYKQCLEDVGKQLQIDVHVCVGGISSEKFQTSWNARMERYKRTQKSVITDGTIGINDDDDDDDDDEIKLSTSGETDSSGSKQNSNDDGCVDFIQRMLDQRRKGKHAPLTSSGSQRSNETSLTLHGILPGRKSRGKRASLRSKPRIRGGVRDFLTLTDRRLQGLASIALRKSAGQQQQQPRQTSNATLKGGLMATRSSTLKQRRQHIGHEANDLSSVDADTSSTATAATKAGPKRKRILGGRKTDENANDRPANGKRAKKDEAAAKTTTTEAEAAMVHADNDANDDDSNDAHSRGDSTKAGISFRPGCLIFLDDIFVAQSSLHQHRNSASNVNETRSNDRNELLDAVGLASQISLELSHHMQV